MISQRANFIGIGLALVAPLVAFDAEAQQIITRQQWGARPAIERREPPIQTGKANGATVVAENVMPRRQRARYLTVHHTGSPARPGVSTRDKVRQFQRLMQEGYWIGTTKHIFLGDIPYHYFISSQGQVAEGRELRFAPYSNTEYETPIAEHITVVLEGNFQASAPTANQMTALKELLRSLAVTHNISLNSISYHQHVATTHTVCPGQQMINKMPEVIDALRQRGID